MVSTQLKIISQIGSFPQVGANIKNIWNHHTEENHGRYNFWLIPRISTSLSCFVGISRFIYLHFPPVTIGNYPNKEPTSSGCPRQPFVLQQCFKPGDLPFKTIYIYICIYKISSKITELQTIIGFLPHRINELYIYLHLVYFYGKLVGKYTSPIGFLWFPEKPKYYMYRVFTCIYLHLPYIYGKSRQTYTIITWILWVFLRILQTYLQTHRAKSSEPRKSPSDTFHWIPVGV